MVYPLIEKTYFESENLAWSFAQAIAKLNHYIVSDYGVDKTNEKEPYYIETWNDPFSTKRELLNRWRDARKV